MENTKSKITVNLYGNKFQAVMPYSDPTLDEIVSAFVGLLEEHDFNLEDIHEAFMVNFINTKEESDYEYEEDTFKVPPGFEAFIKGRENGKQ
jgi:hypothetical protein